jgi:hypothetical protein
MVYGLKRGVTVMFPLFPLGQVVATPGALAALERAKPPWPPPIARVGARWSANTSRGGSRSSL